MSPDSADAIYLEAGIPILKEYLLSKELFWPFSARGYSLPRLTLGGIMLAMARLQARGEQISTLTSKLDAVRSKWRVAWETKAGLEFQSRMRLWGNFLADYGSDPEENGDAYPYEVRTRVMLELLMAESPVAKNQKNALQQLDGTLRKSFISGDFIWDDDLEVGFPREQFWYLYGRLKS